MEKYCVKCQVIVDTGGFFCPTCGTILDPNLQTIKTIKAKTTKESESEEINFRNPIYIDRKPPSIKILLEKYPSVRHDYKNHFKPITLEQMLQEIIANKQKYACQTCTHFSIGYCLNHLWEVASTALCTSYELFSQWPTKYHDKRVTKTQIKAFEFIPQQEEDIQKKFSYQVIRLSIKREEEQGIAFFNNSKDLNQLPTITAQQEIELLNERKQIPFKSFADISARTSIKDPIGLLSLRILYELTGKSENYLLLTPAKQIKLEK